MSEMLNLTCIFQFIVDCFNKSSFSQQDFVGDVHRRVFHNVKYFSNQMNTTDEKGLKKFFRDIVFVTEEFSLNLFQHFTSYHRFPVITIGLSNNKIQQFALIIDDKIQFFRGNALVKNQRTSQYCYAPFVQFP